MNFSKKNHEYKNINKNDVSKKLRLTTIMVMAFVSLTAMSCKDGKKEVSTDTVHAEMNPDKMNASNKMMDSNSQHPGAQKVLADYMVLKDALVETDKDKAAKAGEPIEQHFKRI